MKRVSSSKDIPEAPHYAVIEFNKVFISGRTNPGHGYEEHYLNTISYIVFNSKEELQDWITQREKQKYPNTPFRVIESFPKQVTSEIKVTLT